MVVGRRPKPRSERRRSKVDRAAAPCNGPPMLAPRVSVSAKAQAEIVVAPADRGFRIRKRGGKGSCAAPDSPAAGGCCDPQTWALFVSNVHRCTARRDRRVTLPPRTAFPKISTMSIPLVINPAIRCKPRRSPIASIASSGATANLTWGGI